MFIYTFLVKKWNFDQVANDFISVRSLNFGYSTSFKIADKGSIEVLGPLGIASQILNFSKTTVLIQSGLVFHYASFMLFFMLFFVSFIILSDWLLAVFALTFLYFLISFTNP
jgi:NADH-ubiquinone oxidoreductase chain 5